MGVGLFVCSVFSPVIGLRMQCCVTTWMGSLKNSSVHSSGPSFSWPETFSKGKIIISRKNKRRRKNCQQFNTIVYNYSCLVFLQRSCNAEEVNNWVRRCVCVRLQFFQLQEKEADSVLSGFSGCIEQFSEAN